PDLSRDFRRALSRHGTGPGRAPGRKGGQGRDRSDGGRAALRRLSNPERLQLGQLLVGCGGVSKQTLLALWAEKWRGRKGRAASHGGGQGSAPGVVIQLSERFLRLAQTF